VQTLRSLRRALASRLCKPALRWKLLGILSEAPRLRVVSWDHGTVMMGVALKRKVGHGGERWRDRRDGALNRAGPVWGVSGRGSSNHTARCILRKMGRWCGASSRIRENRKLYCSKEGKSISKSTSSHLAEDSNNASTSSAIFSFIHSGGCLRRVILNLTDNGAPLDRAIHSFVVTMSDPITLIHRARCSSSVSLFCPGFSIILNRMCWRSENRGTTASMLVQSRGELSATLRQERHTWLRMTGVAGVFLSSRHWRKIRRSRSVGRREIGAMDEVESVRRSSPGEVCILPDTRSQISPMELTGCLLRLLRGSGSEWSCCGVLRVRVARAVLGIQGARRHWSLLQRYVLTRCVNKCNADYTPADQATSGMLLSSMMALSARSQHHDPLGLRTTHPVMYPE